MVEFALVAPLFFLLLFGIIEAGRFIFYYETLNNATREGARYAIVNGANTLGCPSGPAAPGTTSCDTPGRQRRRSRPSGRRRRPGSGITVTGAGGTRSATLRPRRREQRTRFHRDRDRQLHVLEPRSPRASSTHQCVSGVEPCYQQLATPGSAGRSSSSSPGASWRLLLVAALAFDVGMMLVERRDEQNAADAAALAGARYVLVGRGRADRRPRDRTRSTASTTPIPTRS